MRGGGRPAGRAARCGGALRRRLCQTFEAVNENFNGRDFVFLPKQHRSEVYCADRIHMMLRYPPESITGIDREIAEIGRTRRHQVRRVAGCDPRGAGKAF